MTDSQQLREALRNFVGTETWWRHNLNRNMLYTDGVKFFAEEAGGGAYWFLDIMATEVFPLMKHEAFLVIKMVVAERPSACRIVAEDGNGRKVWHKGIDFTDCPAGTWEFYLTDNVLLLPSEY